MTESVVLIARIAMALALYGFLAGAIYVIWRDLRAQSALITNRQAPRLTFIRHDEGQSSEQSFTSAEIIIGRDKTCDYILTNDTVSGRHARLSHHHSQWWIEDLQSTNGTFLNDERVETAIVVISGDELRCGQALLEMIIAEVKR